MELLDYRLLANKEMPDMPVPASAPPFACCVVTSELVGPSYDADIGLANVGLAEWLAKQGQKVTLLYTNIGRYEARFMETDFSDWQKRYAQAGIDLVPLPWVDAIYGDPIDPLRVSLRTYNWLKQRAFGRVYFNDFQAAGYHTLVAKSLGLGFSSTRLLVLAQANRTWLREANKNPYRSADEIQLAFMEKRCCEMADVLVSPTRFFVDWMGAQKWRMPRTVCVIPPLTPTPFLSRLLGGAMATPSDNLPKEATEDPARKVTELVFLGSQQPRKGLRIFLDALDQLKLKLLPPELPRLAFLGPFSKILKQHSGSEILLRLRDWPARFEFMPGFNPASAPDYLRPTHRLAVIPSMAENASSLVVQLLREGLPFLATSAGGIPELVDEAEARALVTPAATELAERLRVLLREGSRPLKPAWEAETLEKAWWNLHLLTGNEAENPPVPPPSPLLRRAPEEPPLPGQPKYLDPWMRNEPHPDQGPFISVVITHYNRPDYLWPAIQSLEQQTYPNFEVIVVDDGSTTEPAKECLATLELRLKDRGWRLLRQPNRYLGAARNAGAAVARGEYLLFMDDDNLALPAELATFAQAAFSSQADILTCLSLWFQSHPPELAFNQAHIWYVPCGGCVGAGLVTNCLGDANALVRREVFQRLGGFNEQRGFACQDHLLFLQAVLEGYRLEVVPEPLYFYHQSAEGMYQQAHPMESAAPIYAMAGRWPAAAFSDAFDLLTQANAVEGYVYCADERCRQQARGEFWTTLKAADENSREALEALGQLAKALGRVEEAEALMRLVGKIPAPKPVRAKPIDLRKRARTERRRRWSKKLLSAKWRRTLRKRLVALYISLPK